MLELTAGLALSRPPTAPSALRALNNQLGRLEVDRERPESWCRSTGGAEVLLLDNPTSATGSPTRHESLLPDLRHAGDAVFQPITAQTQGATVSGPARVGGI